MPTTKFVVVANHRSNGHANGFQSLDSIADLVGDTSQADRRDWAKFQSLDSIANKIGSTSQADRRDWRENGRQKSNG